MTICAVNTHFVLPQTTTTACCWSWTKAAVTIVTKMSTTAKTTKTRRMKMTMNAANTLTPPTSAYGFITLYYGSLIEMYHQEEEKMNYFLFVGFIFIFMNQFYATLSCASQLEILFSPHTGLLGTTSHHCCTDSASKHHRWFLEHDLPEESVDDCHAVRL